MEKTNKTGWVIAVVVVVVIIIGLIVWKSDGTMGDYSNNDGTSTPTPTPTDDSNTGVQVGTGTGARPLSYTQALVAYANRRVQFSRPQGLTSCQATPTTVTFKGTTEFMLDNRMGSVANIHFSSGVNYSLPAYSFQVITLTTPRTYIIDCNGSTNVSTVQIQK